MKTAALASLVATAAAAFTPTQHEVTTASTTALKAFEYELGAQPPLGFFDPLGIVEDGDPEKFYRLRYVELKHGRICMLGVVGFLVNKAGIYLPGDIDLSGTKFSDLGDGWAASFSVPGAGALQVLLFVGFLELAVMKDITGGEFPGDFRNEFLDFGWDTWDEYTQYRKRAIELNQGRAAMMGMLGLMVHDQLGNIDLILPS